MKPLSKIRAEREQMSAIERRIADFILDNAQLLRDYSSQQLAAALGISQSSVVKFSQKLGYRGYPDLKYSIAEAMTPEVGAIVPATEEMPELLSGDLWRRKSESEAETRAISSPTENLRSGYPLNPSFWLNFTTLDWLMRSASASCCDE